MALDTSPTMLKATRHYFSNDSSAPLSPTNEPEEIEIAGILAKSLEIALLVGIAFIIKWDKEAFHRMMMKIKH